MMKKILFLLLTFSFIFTGCTKSPEEKKKEKAFKEFKVYLQMVAKDQEDHFIRLDNSKNAQDVALAIEAYTVKIIIALKKADELRIKYPDFTLGKKEDIPETLKPEYEKLKELSSMASRVSKKNEKYLSSQLVQKAMNDQVREIEIHTAE